MLRNVEREDTLKRDGFMMIKEAAATYSVSRAKIHRLISRGRLTAVEDPRDERVKLLRREELDTLFQLHAEEGNEVGYDTEQAIGRITPEIAARMDAVRERIAASGIRLPDSTGIIREERDKRSRHLYAVATGMDDRPDEETSRR